MIFFSHIKQADSRLFKPWVYILILCFTNKAAAQNLIPNSSFEINNCCSNIGSCTWTFPILNGSWNDSSTQSSAAYFNACFNYNVSFQFQGVPKNDIGYQNARLGNAYAGIYTLFKNPHQSFYNTRRFLSNIFFHKLIPKAKYDISLYINLSNHYNYGCKNIQALFTEKPPVYTYNGFTITNLTSYTNLAHFKTDSLTDTLNWKEIKATYVANGTERFISIGNYLSDSVSTYYSVKSDYPSDTLGYNWDAAFYYIDDVSVTLGIDAGRDTLLCQAESSTKLTASPGWQHYKWSTGDTGISITVNKAGTYIVTGTVDSLPNYSKTDTVVVYKNSLPTKLLAQKDTTIYVGDTLVLNAAAGFMQYKWSTGETGRTIQILNLQSSILNYAVTVYTSEGCMLTDTIHITFKEKPKEVELPIIVPNPQYIGKATAFKVLNLPQGAMAYLYNGVGQDVSNALQRTTFFTEGIYYYLLVLPSGKVVKGKVLLLKE